MGSSARLSAWADFELSWGEVSWLMLVDVNRRLLIDINWWQLRKIEKTWCRYWLALALMLTLTLILVGIDVDVYCLILITWYSLLDLRLMLVDVNWAWDCLTRSDIGWQGGTTDIKYENAQSTQHKRQVAPPSVYISSVISIFIQILHLYMCRSLHRYATLPFPTLPILSYPNPSTSNLKILNPLLPSSLVIVF